MPKHISVGAPKTISILKASSRSMKKIIPKDYALSWGRFKTCSRSRMVTATWMSASPSQWRLSNAIRITIQVRLARKMRPSPNSSSTSISLSIVLKSQLISATKVTLANGQSGPMTSFNNSSRLILTSIEITITSSNIIRCRLVMRGLIYSKSLNISSSLILNLTLLGLVHLWSGNS